MHGSAVASSWQTDLCDGGVAIGLPALKGLIALRLLACLAALAGGVVLAVAGLLDGTPAALYWVGLVLVAAAVAGAGAGLVKSGAGWLRVVVGVAFPAMVLSLYSAVRPADPDLVDLGAGVAALVLGVVFLVRPPRASGRERYRGSHAG